MIKEETNIVPLFKNSFEELQIDEQQIYADFNADMDAIEKLYHLTVATLHGDAEELSKFDGADQTLGKVAADRLVDKNRGRVSSAKIEAGSIALATARDALLKRDRRLFGLDALSKRSARRIAALAARSSK